MKRLILLISLASQSLTVQASWPWILNNYSILYGPGYYAASSYSHAIEFQFDKGKHENHRTSYYWGSGIQFTVGNEIKELGIKAMLGTHNLGLRVTRKLRFVPYLFVYGTGSTLNNSFKESNLNIRPGLGYTGIFRKSGSINYRTYVQIGYNISDAYYLNKDGFTLELKIGVGFDRLGLKYSREKKRLKEQQPKSGNN